MTSAVRIAAIRVDRRSDRHCASTPAPPLAWLVDTDLPDWRQSAVELRFGDDEVRLDTAESSFVAWPFAPLAPHARGELAVRVTGVDGSRSEWSDPVVVTSVFLGDGEWRADLIGLAETDRPGRPALLRRSFDVAREVVAATLFATAEGVYQASVNGEDVDDHVLKPGWTVYQSRRLFETTDVTGLLVPGENVLGIRLAGGWWTEEYGPTGAGARVYGEQPTAGCQLRIEYRDGAIEWITTDVSWQSWADGPIVLSGIYQGEVQDARRHLPGWDRPGFDASGWAAVRAQPSTVVPGPVVAEPVRRTQELPVADLLTSPSGKTILDFGQNFVGRLRIRIHGQRGQILTLRHAEVLEHGELALRPLREAAATDTLILAGGGAETLEPEFTFHGFRYAQIDGWEHPDPTAVTGIVLGSDLRRTGWLETSEPLIDRLHENAVWAMRGNFLSLPTDCPQRNERFGWTGDAQVFAPSASFLHDSDAFFVSWLADVAAEQRANGGVAPYIVPNVLGDWAASPAAGWGDAATVVPMALYTRFGDLPALRSQLPFMTAWCDAVLARTDDDGLWRNDFQFGDWLDPTAPPDRPLEARTDPQLVANAYLVRSLELTAEAARALDEDDMAARYGGIAEQTRTAFDAAYLRADDRLSSDAPTAYALALAFGLFDGPARRDAFGARLAELVAENGHRVPTGFLGTPVLLDALTMTGHVADALALLFQTENPSWLYQVLLGATTIWERWDSLLPDGTVNPGEMTSFNHYTFGSVVDWLHRAIGGIAPAEPGYRTVRVAPADYARFERVRCAHETPYGLVEVAWRRANGRVELRVAVPPNSRAEVVLPAATVVVGSGRHRWEFELPRQESGLERPSSVGS